MPRFRFDAVQADGRVLRGVLSADSAAQARELLLENEIFGKRIEEVGDDVALTWAPKRSHTAKPFAQCTKSIEKYQTTITDGPNRGAKAVLILLSDGNLELDVAGQIRHLSRDRIETIMMVGFPWKTCRIVLLTGEMIDLAAGFLLAPPSLKRIMARTSERSQITQ